MTRHPERKTRDRDAESSSLFLECSECSVKSNFACCSGYIDISDKAWQVPEVWDEWELW